MCAKPNALRQMLLAAFWALTFALAAPAHAALPVTTQATPDTAAPVISAGPTVVKLGDRYAVVRWVTDKPADAALFVGPAANDLTRQLGDARLATEHLVVVTKLAPDTDYFFEVSSNDEKKNGPVQSEVIAFRTAAQADATAPRIVGGPLVTRPTPTSARVTWTTDEWSTGELSYAPKGTTVGLKASTGTLALEHSVTITGLTTDVPYDFHIAARDIAGNGLDSPDRALVAGGLIRDLNFDGKSDILFRHATSGANQLWLIDGTARSTVVTVPTVLPSTGWRIAATGDANGDGKADIFWRNTSGSNYVWLMNSGSVIGQGALPFVGDAAWEIAGAADFNADGKSDLLWRHAGTGANQLWLIDGTTRSAVVSVPGSAPSGGWKIAALGDANADGRADIFWRNTSGSNYLWLMNSGTVIGQGALPAMADASWEIAGAADFNADGKSDLLWRHAASGANQLWLINGTSRSALVGVPTVLPGSGWKIAALGDASGDGRADIFWRNTNGSNYVWLMNGGSVLGQGALPAMADVGWEVVGK